MNQEVSPPSDHKTSDLDSGADMNSVSAWRELLSRRGLDSALTMLSRVPAWKTDIACFAMEAAFEEKSKEMALAIDKRWRPHLNLRQLSNEADWIHREILLFLRGGDEFWLRMLLSNNGHAQKDLFSSCFQEVENQIRSRADIEVERVARCVDLAFEYGASTLHIFDNGEVNALTKASRLLPLIAAHYPDQEASWKSVIDKIERLNARIESFNQHELDLKRVLDDLTPENMALLEPAVKRALEIPKAHRRVSPFEIIFDKFEDTSYMENIERSGYEYPVIQAFKALLSHGFDINAYQPYGKTAVHSLVRNHSLQSSILDECLQVALSYGADLDLTEMVSLEFPWANGTHVLHEVVYMGSSPIQIMAERCASIDPQDDLGNTPAIYAARERKYDLVSEMLRLGADPRIQNEDGNTLAHEMCGNALFEFLEVPFDLATMCSAMQVIKKSGFDFEVKNKDGKCCFELLCANVSSDDRAALCKQILQSLDEQGWNLPWGNMQQALLTTSASHCVHDFLAEKISELDATYIRENTVPSTLSSRRKRL